MVEVFELNNGKLTLNQNNTELRITTNRLTSLKKVNMLRIENRLLQSMIRNWTHRATCDVNLKKKAQSGWDVLEEITSSNHIEWSSIVWFA